MYSLKWYGTYNNNFKDGAAQDNQFEDGIKRQKDYVVPCNAATVFIRFFAIFVIIEVLRCGFLRLVLKSESSLSVFCIYWRPDS